jgi:hypothetical protein
VYEELKGAKKMLGLNNIQIIGNLGGTPDMKFLNDGKSQVVNFSVAVNERWKNRDGEPQERTTWLRVVAFNGLGQACAEHQPREKAFTSKAASRSASTKTRTATSEPPSRWSHPRSGS